MIGRGARQNSNIFDSNELGDAWDMLMFVKQIKRTQEILGTRLGEPRRCVDKCFYKENTTHSFLKASA